MSRNPYLAASRPSSSYTRSSRSSNYSPSYGLGRSRSSAALSGRTNRVYCAGYIPASQRSSSTTRYSQPNDSPTSTPSNRASEYTPSSRVSKDYEATKTDRYDTSSKEPLPKSSSSHDISSLNASYDDEDKHVDDDNQKESGKTSDFDVLSRI